MGFFMGLKKKARPYAVKTNALMAADPTQLFSLEAPKQKCMKAAMSCQ